MKSDLENYTQDYCKAEQIIIRKAKLKEIESINKHKQVYIFHGAPGQGKTVFAHQMAETYYYEYIWYDISEDDKDPIFLCKSLHHKLSTFYPKYSCDEFDQLLIQNKLDPLQYETYIKTIIRSLKKVIRKRIAIIFDNADKLPAIGLAYKTIQSAISLSSTILHFIVCSRNTNHNLSNSNQLENHKHLLDNDFFTITANEFKSLALKHLDDMADLKGLEKIYEITEGWAHGIDAAFTYLKTYDQLPSIDDLSNQLDHYFKAIELHTYDTKEFTTCSLLALLKDIKIDLAIQCHGNSSIAKFIMNLFDNNNFIKRSSSMHFSLHPLYANWLSNICYNQLTRLDIELFLIQAADYELEHHNLTNALRYLIKAKTYSKLEQVIKENIDAFLVTKEEYSLFGILSDIPVTIFRNSLWMPLAYSIVTKCISLDKTEGMLLHTLKNFQKHDNHIGVILSSCGLITYNSFISGDIVECRYHLDQVKSLLREHESELSQIKLLEVYTSILLGCLFTEAGCDTKTILDKASALTNEIQAVNHKFVLNYLFFIYYEKTGNIGLSEKHLNLLITSVNHSTVNSLKTLTIIMSIYFSFSENGHYKAQEILSSKIRQKARLYLDRSLYLKVSLDVFDADNALHNGDTDQAERYIEIYSNLDLDSMPSSISSIIYAYKAVINALRFEDGAEENANKALELSIESGFPKNTHCKFIYFVGVVKTYLGKYKEAESNLLDVIAHAQETGNDRYNAAAHAYLSYLANNVGNKKDAKEYAVISIKYLKKSNSDFFRLALPEVMQNLLEHAHKDEIVADYTKDIAYNKHDKSFSSKKELIPLMEINAFGEMKITLSNHSLSTDALAGNFRLMIGILVSSKEYSINQETIQSYIWPSSSKEHARTSFDNLMSRYRKLLKDSFKGVNPKDYITINNGIVRLINTKCNADIFIQTCNNAWINYDKGNYSNSIKHLLETQDMYTDRYLPFLTGIEKINARREYTDQAFIGLITLIYQIGNYSPDLIQLDYYFTKWLDVYIHNTEMVKIAYMYYKKKKDRVKCLTILNNYNKHLVTDGFSSDEIDELLYIIKTSN